MPAKAKVTKEMIVDAAFAIAREAGAENINARTVAERLHCSTQPVMYHFATMDELKRTVYAKADLYHSEYLMTMKKPPKGAALGIGMNYIRFAIEEPHLFRFLFQSDYFNGKTLLELIDAEELIPVLSAMQRSLGIGMEQTKTVFITVFLFAHGYASMIANNSLKYDARIATTTNDNALREKTAALWTKLNGVTILPEMINCTGCRIEGVKTPFCDRLCPVHNCVREKGLNTCADCGQMDGCPTLGRIAKRGKYEERKF